MSIINKAANISQLQLTLVQLYLQKVKLTSRTKNAPSITGRNQLVICAIQQISQLCVKSQDIPGNKRNDIQQITDSFSKFQLILNSVYTWLFQQVKQINCSQKARSNSRSIFYFQVFVNTNLLRRTLFAQSRRCVLAVLCHNDNCNIMSSCGRQSRIPQILHKKIMKTKQQVASISCHDYQIYSILQLNYNVNQNVQNYWFTVFFTFEGSNLCELVLKVYNHGKVIQQHSLVLEQLQQRQQSYRYSLNESRNQLNDLIRKQITAVESRVRIAFIVSSLKYKHSNNTIVEQIHLLIFKFSKCQKQSS
ncbi:Hypothetical_protein [Hexamita inflata]|uniref:Hypothetical_protein n=1 Tax=Hexamita inflata TaxID=28002 RepID=A0AA86QN05_9EUKA|nr:Hypothetical protein HINF_LOCUS44542 [Hexamita inflata]